MEIEISQWKNRNRMFHSWKKLKRYNNYRIHKKSYSCCTGFLVLTLTSKSIRILVLLSLLLLCGDNQSNPGSDNKCKRNLNKFPIQGNIHHGNEMFSSSSRGKQCVSCGLTFYLRFLHIHLISLTGKKSDLDHIGLLGIIYTIL